MKLQAITVSVDYADFLVFALEENYQLFDEWVIITSYTDDETFRLCQKYENVKCIRTNVFYENGAKFNKFAGINLGLSLLDNPEWVLFLDSDIILHNETRRILENLELNPTYLYGVDRLNCIGIKSWYKFNDNRELVIDNWMLTNANMPLGARLVHYYGYENGDGKFAGWNPLGFFQLAHSSSFDSYPQDSIGADHCDLVFARMWQRSRRILIPEILVIHLESKFIIKGTNWNGRISEPFNSTANIPSLKYIFKLILLKINLLYRYWKRIILNK